MNKLNSKNLNMYMTMNRKTKPIGTLPPRRKENPNDIKKAINNIFNGKESDEEVENSIERVK